MKKVGNLITGLLCLLLIVSCQSGNKSSFNNGLEDLPLSVLLYRWGMTRFFRAIRNY